MMSGQIGDWTDTGLGQFRPIEATYFDFELELCPAGTEKERKTFIGKPSA